MDVASPSMGTLKLNVDASVPSNAEVITIGLVIRDHIDRTLDDMIKSNKKSGGRGRGRSFGPGPRRFDNRSFNRPAPYSSPQPSKKQGLSLEFGTKLYISNLDYGVSQEDIKELFSEIGDLKRCVVHYDRSGRSKGTADVIFSHRQDALSAVTKYNNVQLDGKPMKVVIVGTNIVTPGVGPLTINDNTINDNGSNFNGVPRGGQGRGGFGRSRGGSRGRGSGRGRGEKLSQDDLDADLDKYHAESMQIN
ncbi:THO complex subunit 4A [Heracleum sosnowskyi]|uniref:THO complex subunit 4A n=1 Tax=Heracleum sosnowskyi TaxID=360622 RepID=A0AAD8H0B8_9APIA|nr:THO complex subunit 4A [Heracleum sosnowskyi]